MATAPGIASTGDARRVVVLGAGGRDFHDFNVLYRGDPNVRVTAFTAAQIPGIDDRRYPSSLAGSLYPDGIPIRPEADLEEIVRDEGVDEVVLAYSDLSAASVLELASRALAAGADFSVPGPRSTMLRSRVPVLAVCAVRTGCGKSQTARHVGGLLAEVGLRPVLVRHPMPYGNLEAMRVQRFASYADIDAADPTIEEREEYEESVRAGLVVYAGVDYADVLAAAEDEADVIVWDGGNNDFPFFVPDVLITLVDALRPRQAAHFHPGATNLRMADVIVVAKSDAATPGAVSAVEEEVRSVNRRALMVRAGSPVSIADGPDLTRRRVVVVEDGPSITHGGMPFGAGTVAARAARADIVDPRPHAVGSIAATFEAYPHIEAVVPAMGYDPEQVADLRATLAASGADAIVSGTPVDLERLVHPGVPVHRARYRYADVGEPTLASALAEPMRGWRAASGRS